MTNSFLDTDMPVVLKDFLVYMQTIKGKSINTIQVYFYDLRVFLRFLKLHRNLVSKETKFDDIDITDIDVGLLKTITLSDLYSFMSFVSNTRSNSAYARARKVASLRSLFNNLTNKAKIMETNPASELD